MRTARELALMEIATYDDAWDGENESPSGSYALVTVSDSERLECELTDDDASQWLSNTSGTMHYVIRWLDSGMTLITEYSEYEKDDAEMHIKELDAIYYAWNYSDIEM